MRDARGYPVSTQPGVALGAAEHALWQMMSFYGTPLDDLAAARAEDPQWLLPPLMQCGFLLSLTEPSVLPEARRVLAACEPHMPSAWKRCSSMRKPKPPAAKPSPAARACLAKPATPLTEHWAARFAAAAHPST